MELSSGLRRPVKGFTLLELMVVLVIGVMLFTLVPPLLSGIGTTTDLRAAARQLIAGLRSARSEAITRQREAVLTMDLEERRFGVTGNPRRYSLPKGIVLELVTAESERLDDRVGAIRFFPDGSSTGGRITLSDQRIAYEVDVDWLTGRVRLFDRELH